MKKSFILSMVLFFALFPMLYHTDYVLHGARRGLLLWYSSVVPALFPFMVLSGMIVAGDGISILMTPVYHILKPLLPISKNGCYVLITGFLCGYPMGAKTCRDFVAEGRITLREGHFLMAVCNHPSPMFLLGYAYPLFSDFVPEWKFLCCIYGPVLILAAISAAVSRAFIPSDPNRYFQRSIPSASPNLTQTTDETILSAVTILCKIGGYLILFSIAIEFIQGMALLPVPLRLGMICALEMTTGIQTAAHTLPPKEAWIMSAAALTFGGFSGIFQTNAVLGNDKKAGLSIRPYIFWKLLHAVLSAGAAFLLCN